MQATDFPIGTFVRFESNRHPTEQCGTVSKSRMPWFECNGNTYLIHEVKIIEVVKPQQLLSIPNTVSLCTLDR